MQENIDYQMQNNTDLDPKPIEEMTFREAMNALNNTVKLLESSSLELEESLSKYQYGVRLLTELQNRLDNAQIQVEQLMGKIETNGMSDEQRDRTLS